jgi:cytochrome c oxidase cbb3-type subunit III
MFYVTIVFAVLYMGYYTFFGGFTQKQEFDSEVAVAAAMYKDIDQVFDAPLADAAALQKAQEIFVSNCAACHKDDLGGSIGPNLTDEFWKNGGGINEIYKTVKYGVQNTAMKSWKNEFDNDQIYAIASFILSKKGSHPEGAKQPEGEIWTK